MVYLTGDTHGDIDRFKHGKLRWLGKRDTVVVLGDFGFVWDDSKEEQKKLDWLRKRPYTLLFLDGSHENYDLLKQYPTEERFGGKVQALGGNVYHVCRGSVLELENKKYLCFGGAESQDVEDREPGVNWWREEMPSEEEYAARFRITLRMPPAQSWRKIRSKQRMRCCGGKLPPCANSWKKCAIRKPGARSAPSRRHSSLLPRAKRTRRNKPFTG